MGSRKRGNRLSQYDRFEYYLGKMHYKALELLNSLDTREKKLVEVYFERYYRTSSEHLWSVTKLFAHAMYVPMFLQIGFNNFSRTIYIDTHSGPGLAKIGKEEHDIVLGSPLISLYWPVIVGSEVEQFKNIKKGFNKIYLVDINPQNVSVLSKFVGDDKRVVIYNQDINHVLMNLSVGSDSLVYMFVDPYASFDTQLDFNALKAFVFKRKVDIMMSVFAKHIARGFSSIKNEATLQSRVEKLFGPGFCGKDSMVAKVLCTPRTITKKDSGISNIVLKAFRLMFKELGYHRIEFIDVPFEKGVLYHIAVATKGSGSWIDGYVNYMKNKAPKDYETLRRIWLHTVGRTKTLDEFF